MSPRQPSGKNIIRWLLKKRTNGSVRYCQYTSVCITQCRSRCIEKSSRTRKIQRISVCDIRDAATRTLKDMGIDQKKEDPLRGSPLNNLHKRRGIQHRHR
ncbi:PerC family transcriptional regulator [Escherichia coli]|uniref:PerC family transcriptional regulator n=1 Tax=Escherichia coli TaxID=562 RepID=A0A828P0H7_ECOLX|nr:PerC family transcriptional regulator [Escherichia coli]